jgi:serine/threonine protein kinase
MQHNYIIINNQYALSQEIGKGSFGSIYAGIDLRVTDDSPDRLVAIKLELRNAKIQLLKSEADIYRYLYKENRGIPKIYWSGIKDDYNVLVIEMLGPNLEKLFTLCSHRFSLKTVLLIAQEVIKKIKYVHSRGIIHRDIKPDNFLIGLQNYDIYIVDFGLCKFFKNSDGTHIPEATNKKLVGSVRYASINGYLGHELSRRDDLISIGYMLIYFLRGSLPWQGLTQKNTKPEDKYRLVFDCKMKTSAEQLCQGLPKEFTTYMEYVNHLKFNERPDYNFIYNLFTQLFKKSGFSYDDEMDWSKFKNT